MSYRSFMSGVAGVVRRPGFWFIVAVTILITIPYYGEELEHPSFITDIIADFNLGRHAFERILYLAPIVWAGFLFGWRGSFITSLIALAVMLPRAIAISEYPKDALFETGAVFVIGNVLALSFHSLRRERENRIRLESARQELQSSEEKYRQLFENAHDAIWLHDLDGNFIAANNAAAKLSGYTAEELCKMNVKSFLSEESLRLAQLVGSQMLDNEPVEQPYEQRILKRDGAEATVQIASSLVLSKGKAVAFQHVARDISEQKRMQENLRYYLHEITRAQEEERKRISHELHDDTIQALVALSRQLDHISGGRDVPEELRARLEKLWKQTNDIVGGVRRLSHDLRPAALDRLGLLPALEWLASETKKYSGIETAVKVIGAQRRLPEEVELVLFRVTQEALRNVWRHSQAGKSEITIEFGEAKTRITVSDNGKGFTLPEKMGDLPRAGKLGLAGMEERARLLGGAITIQSQPEKGTSVTIEIPETASNSAV